MLSRIATTDWFPLFNSLRVAAIASVLVFFLGIGCAHWAARLPPPCSLFCSDGANAAESLSRKKERLNLSFFL